MLKNEIIREIIQYIVLIVVFSICALYYFQIADIIGRFLIIVLAMIFYIGWGCWHHGSKERLTGLIIFEYSLVALIVVLLFALGLGVFRFF